MATSLLAHFRFRWLYFSWWLLWAFLHALVVRSFELPWIMAIADSGISNGLLLLSGLLLMNTLRFYVPRSDRYYILLVWVLVLTALWLLLCHFALNLLFDYSYYAFVFRRSLIIRFSIGFLINAIMVLISVAWYNWHEQQALQQRQSEANKIAKEAELFKLRQQLQPHFLFNSLNSISALIGLQPTAARKMVLQLSEFLRGTLKKEEHQSVELKEEMDYLQLYLEIEKVRFGHRLATEMHIAADAESLQLPALVLQPIVENAIKFGLYDTTGEITILIEAQKEKNDLVISVQNPFDPQTTLPKGTGFGLSSIHRRLYLLFGRSDLLTTETKGSLFMTRLKVPQQNDR